MPLNLSDIMIVRPDNLCLLTGPSTIVSPSWVGLLADAPRSDDGFAIHQVSPDERVFLQGDFSDFHLYLIVVHTKFRVLPGSVSLLKGDRFSAELYYEPQEGVGRTVRLWFRTPILPVIGVKECSYGSEPDAFEFEPLYGNVQRFPCSLSFVTQYSTRKLSIPAKVEYIGISAKPGREVHMRLAPGHEKLQSILADVNRRHPFKTVSLFLYKPGRMECGSIAYEDVVETLEASLIQYFKTKRYNKEHLNFPNNRTKLTNTLRAAGVAYIVSVLTSPEGVAIYSDATKPPHEEHVVELQL